MLREGDHPEAAEVHASVERALLFPSMTPNDAEPAIRVLLRAAQRRSMTFEPSKEVSLVRLSSACHTAKARPR